MWIWVTKLTSPSPSCPDQLGLGSVIFDHFVPLRALLDRAPRSHKPLTDWAGQLLLQPVRWSGQTLG